jgi:glycerol-3-phosphate dehydrogenase
MSCIYDVLIIGGGVIGCSVARELTRYRLSVCVVEKEPDICMGTSGRNSAVLHAGFNNTPGSLMAKFCVEGNRAFDETAKELDIPYKRTGKLVVGFSDEDMQALLKMKEQGEKNGIQGIEIVGREFIDKKAPMIKGNFAMWSPTTAILSPFQFVFAMAENAVKNGAVFYRGSEVTDIVLEKYGVYSVSTSKGVFKSRWIVNCAGLWADKIASMLGIDGYTVHPCRGEYYILDKRLKDMLPLPAYPVPDYRTGGLGIHLTPTVDGNIMIGPSMEYIDERDDHSTTKDIMDMLLKDGSRIFPYLKQEYFIRNFAGIRPKLTSKEEGGYHDFVIERRDDTAPHAVNLVGIESPGLTSAVPIAREVVRLIGEVEELRPDPDFDPVRRAFPSFRDKPLKEQAELVEKNPDYGEIVCRCETITRAEVLNAINGPLGAETVAGVKYRCRAMMGRCQSGYCQAKITRMLMKEKGMAPEELLYERHGSYIFTGKVRG